MSLPTLLVEVRGSEGDIYQVSFSKDTTGVNVQCSCKAGQIGQFCRHRLSLLAGDKSAMVDTSKESALAEALSWSEFASVKANVSELKKVGVQIETLKKVEASLKKKIARDCGV